MVGLPKPKKDGDKYLVDSEMNLMTNNVPMEEGDQEELAYQDDYNMRQR